MLRNENSQISKREAEAQQMLLEKKMESSRFSEN